MGNRAGAQAYQTGHDDHDVKVLDSWGLSTWPGLAVMFVGISFSLLGDGLRDVLDPRMRR